MFQSPKSLKCLIAFNAHNNLNRHVYSPHFTDRETEAQRIAQSHTAQEERELGFEPRSVGPQVMLLLTVLTASARLQCLEKLKMDRPYDPEITFAALCSTETCTCARGDKYKNAHCN